MIVGQVDESDPGGTQCLNAMCRRTKYGSCFPDGRLVFDERALQVGHHQVCLSKQRQKIMEQSLRITAFEVREILTNGTQVSSDEHRRHGHHALIACFNGHIAADHGPPGVTTGAAFSMPP
jgi:hypothetical protein